MSALLELSRNPLLEKINPHPDDQRRFLVLVGYINSATKETVTVYPELDLRSYLEIPTDEIAWAEKAIPGQVSSPTKLVINAAAKVNRVTTKARHVEAGFLSGMIASTCLTTSASGATVKVVIENNPLTPTVACPPPPGQAVAKGSGGTSNCRLTGVCISDPALPLD
jgi:hypothetical protein